jgi:hypothetical protein
MKAMIQATTPHSAVRCPACESHSRPLYVPWQQHAVGCVVREAELRRERELRPTLLLVATAA